MTILELEKKMKELGISEHRYSIMAGGLPNERLCITKEDQWQVYYSERGDKTGLKLFKTESEACDYFYELMLGSIRLDKEFEENN